MFGATLELGALRSARNGGEWLVLSTLPAALAEQVSAEPDGAAGSSAHRLRVAAMAMGQERARGSGSNRAVTTGTSGH